MITRRGFVGSVIASLSSLGFIRRRDNREVEGMKAALTAEISKLQAILDLDDSEVKETVRLQAKCSCHEEELQGCSNCPTEEQIARRRLEREYAGRMEGIDLWYYTYGYVRDKGESIGYKGWLERVNGTTYGFVDLNSRVWKMSRVDGHLENTGMFFSKSCKMFVLV